MARLLLPCGYNCQAPLRRGVLVSCSVGRCCSLPSPPFLLRYPPACCVWSLGNDGCVRGSSLLRPPPTPGGVPRHKVAGALLEGRLFGCIPEGPGRRLTDYGRMVSWSGRSCCRRGLGQS